MSLAGGASRYTGNLDQTEVASYQVKKGGRPNTIISESGLYKLIMRSDKPEAKAFQDWVTVIPPFLAVVRSRAHAATASFCFGVMPPSAMFGRS